LQESTNTIAANAPDADPTAPPAAPRAKTRFSSREIEVKQRKVDAKKTKVAEKAKATPIAATTEEQQTHTAQAEALGLNGSNAKPKKVKRKKGDPKERLQQKPIEQAAPLNDNGLPGRLHQVDAPTNADGTKRTSDSTTLPPANQPAPGSLAPSPTPSPNGTSPTSNQPVPQQ
jgi:peptidyl-prolyl cis-trans isomerase SurA